MRSLLRAIAMLSAVGCQTQFIGNPHIDAATCQARCAADHLQMSGMVYMGEYSSACVCEVPRSDGPLPPRPPGVPPAALRGSRGSDATTPVAGSLGATAGVIMQMRASEEAASSSTSPRP